MTARELILQEIADNTDDDDLDELNIFTGGAKLSNIITEEITLDELEHVVRNVYIDQIKKQMKNLRANDEKTHHMFFVAVKGKTLADKIKNDTIKVLNKAIKKKPDILKRMNASQAEKEIRNNVSLLAAKYILAAQKDTAGDTR